jgi:hypothetical protein
MTYVNHVLAHIAFLGIRTAASRFLPYSDLIDVAGSADYIDLLLGGATVPVLVRPTTYILYQEVS